MRILDSKDSEDKELLKNAPLIYDFLNNNELESFENLKTILKSFGINFKVDPLLVRGLDYYSDTTFEFTLKENEKYAVLAGGRYNDLVRELGGENIAGVGWAAGIERLINLKPFVSIDTLPVLIIPTNEKYLKYAFDLSRNLYTKEVRNQIIDQFNLKKSLKYANKIKAKFALILGEYEFNNSMITFKDLENGKQYCLNQSELFTKLL